MLRWPTAASPCRPIGRAAHGRLFPVGRAFEQSPAGIRNLDASDFDRPAALPHALKLYRCKSGVDEIGYRLVLKAAGKQSIHVAAVPPRPGEHFEHPAMAWADASGIRYHLALSH
jgi:hypothetical protein